MIDTEALEASWRQGPEYVDAADVAKLVRQALKREFPGVKFRVRTSKYAGGASVSVRWTDGPTQKQVQRVTDPYAGGGFDGMIDMAYHVSTWLMPDGSAAFAHSPGTTGSRGSVSGYEVSRPHPEAKLVKFMADHVFVDRDLSEAFLSQLEPNVPVNLEGYERDSWRWREPQRFAVTVTGDLEEVDLYA